jgi:hypothetical protein
MWRFLLIGFLLAQCAAAGDYPSIEPVVQGVFPRGLQRGTTAELELKGRNLEGLARAWVAGGGVRAEVIEASSYRARMKVTAATGAEPGRRDLRLAGPKGSTLTWVDVSDRAEKREQEPNSTRERAEELALPALVNGIVTAGDYDYFRFTATAGQTMVFDLLATRNGSTLDGVVELLDEEGRTLAYSDDYYAFKDPHIRHTFAKAGRYFLRVYGSGESGSENGDYRLLAGPMPFAELALPGGGRRGSEVEFALRGVNLGGVKEVTLGPGWAKGVVLEASEGAARVRLRVPETAPPGAAQLHIGGGALPVPFVVGTRPEVTVPGDGARRRDDPLPVELGVVINGVIDAAGAADYFGFSVDGPRKIVVDVESMNLGYLLDPLVAVYDAAGKRIAYQDDPTTNTGKEPANMDPHLVVDLPRAGRYTLAVRDAQFRGEPSFLYRVTLKEAEPDFQVRVVGAHTTLYRGKVNTVHVRVRRIEGWDQPVEIRVENLGPGITAPARVAEPVNTAYKGTCGETHYLDGTNVEIPITVSGDARLDLRQIRFVGRGVREGKTVEREGRARYWKSRIRLLGDAVETPLYAAVADLPGVLLEAPRQVRAGAKATVIVTRLDESGAPLRLEGEGVAAVEVPAGVTRAEVTFAKTGAVVVHGFVGKERIGESAVVRVEAAK